jgi:acetylornithine deacetylase/succinyl-diaminopimelate desuccinylase-like protein
MSDALQKALAYAQENHERFLSDLKEIVAIPSVSMQDEHEDDVLRAAGWLAERLTALGMDKVQLLPTEKHPVVFGEWMGAGADAPTVLIYGHYDVQPVDPIDLWDTEPYEAIQKGDLLFGRGTSDMKGQTVATLAAVEALMQTSGLPVNIKWLFEGEEEMGSPSMETFLPKYKDLLAADFCLNPDAGMIAADKPTITYGLRGLAYFDVFAWGPDHDLHSGLYGGTVHNPAQALIELVAGMHDEKGSITLPGFYDSVRPVSSEEHADMEKLPMDEAFYLSQTGVPELWGEPDYLPVERVGARPTLEVNGFLSGYTGEGSKTVLPAKAMVKISCRLVPDQTPQEVHKQLVAYMEANAPSTIKWEVKMLNAGPTAITDRGLPAIQSMAQAMETVWGQPPLFKREGGSIPVVAMLQNNIGAESILCGSGLPEDNVHAPNERLNLSNWYKVIDAFIHFFYNLNKK